MLLTMTPWKSIPWNRAKGKEKRKAREGRGSMTICWNCGRCASNSRCNRCTSSQPSAQMHAPPQPSMFTITITDITCPKATPPLAAKPQTLAESHTAWIFASDTSVSECGSDIRTNLLVDGRATAHVCPPWLAPEDSDPELGAECLVGPFE